MIYLDTSALTKLVLPETETVALTIWLTNRKQLARLSSEIVHVELVRAVLRTAPTAHAEVRQLLENLRTIPLTPALLAHAGTMPPPPLRSLDAIHLASALQLADHLTAFIAYDHRLADAAEAVGLPVVSPR